MRNVEQLNTSYAACHRGRHCYVCMNPACIDGIAVLAIGPAVAARVGARTGKLRA